MRFWSQLTLLQGIKCNKEAKIWMQNLFPSLLLLILLHCMYFVCLRLPILYFLSNFLSYLIPSPTFVAVQEGKDQRSAKEENDSNLRTSPLCQLSISIIIIIKLGHLFARPSLYFFLSFLEINEVWIRIPRMEQIERRGFYGKGFSYRFLAWA